MKDTRELRAFLVDQMTKVAEGKINSERAKSVANLSQQIYNTLNLEVKMTIAKSKLNGAQVLPVSFDD